MPTSIPVGRILSATTSGFVVGCRVGQIDVPSLGALVRASLEPQLSVYGLISEIGIADDGLVRQLVTADAVSDEVVRDNRERRIVPVEISVVVLGYDQRGRISHQLPPRPPLSLDVIYLCDDDEVRRFTAPPRFGYLRHILRRPELPGGEIIAAHVRHARLTHPDPALWTQAVVRELITLLRDDYALLTSVLSALDPVVDSVGPDDFDK